MKVYIATLATYPKLSLILHYLTMFLSFSVSHNPSLQTARRALEIKHTVINGVLTAPFWRRKKNSKSGVRFIHGTPNKKTTKKQFFFFFFFFLSFDLCPYAWRYAWQCLPAQ